MQSIIKLNKIRIALLSEFFKMKYSFYGVLVAMYMWKNIRNVDDRNTMTMMIMMMASINMISLLNCF